MKVILAIFLVFLGLDSALGQSDFYMSNYNKPSEFIILKMEKYFNGHFETDYKVNLGYFEYRFKECNKGRSIRDIVEERHFKFCLDKSRISLWAGAGRVDIDNVDSAGRTLSLEAFASFLAGQMIFSWDLQTLILLEGKYWYLPDFSDDKENIADNLRLSSYVESLLYMQRRIPWTRWSWRFGFLGMKMPVIRDAANTSFLNKSDFKFNSALAAGPMLGFKYQPGRVKGARHSTVFDYVVLGYQDNEIEFDITGARMFRLAHKWTFHRNWAITGDIEIMDFKRKTGEEVSAETFGLGIQVYFL